MFYEFKVEIAFSDFFEFMGTTSCGLDCFYVKMRLKRAKNGKVLIVEVEFTNDVS